MLIMVIILGALRLGDDVRYPQVSHIGHTERLRVHA